MNRKPTTVLIADRDEIFCEGLARVLERDSRFRITATCCDVPQTVATMRDRRPMVAVLDSSLVHGDPSIDRETIESWHDVHVVIVGAAHGVPGASSIKRGFRAEELIALLESAPVPSAPRGAVGVEALSPREQQVLRLVADGYTSREIAEHLEIKQRTVEVHRHNILSKLELRGVAEMVKFAIREGLTKA